MQATLGPATAPGAVAQAAAAAPTAAQHAVPPPPPPDARPYDRGPHDAAVLGCIDAMTQALRPGHGTLGFGRWLLPAEAPMAAVAAHYQAGLPPGWTAEGSLPKQLQGCQATAWSGGGGVVAIGLTGPFEAPRPFRVLIVATHPPA